MDSTNTRIINSGSQAFNQFKTTGRRSQTTNNATQASSIVSGPYSSQLINLTSSTSASSTPGHGGFPVARDRKPLTPEYEVPSLILDSTIDASGSRSQHFTSHHFHQQQQTGGHFERNIRNHLNLNKPPPPPSSTMAHFHHHQQQQQNHSHLSHPHGQQSQLSNSSSVEEGIDSNCYNVNFILDGMNQDLLSPHPSSSLQTSHQQSHPHSQQHHLQRQCHVNSRMSSLDDNEENKSNMSESHIYSHIYDPSSSSCCCPACDRLSSPDDKRSPFTPSSSATRQYNTNRRTSGLYQPFPSSISTIFRPPVLSPYHSPEKKGKDFKLSVRETEERRKIIKVLVLSLVTILVMSALCFAFTSSRLSQPSPTQATASNNPPPFLFLDPTFNPSSREGELPSPRPTMSFRDSSPLSPTDQETRGNHQSESSIPSSIASAASPSKVTTTTATTEERVPAHPPKENFEEEAACVDGEEWKCNDGLCIPREKRCDGHFNCYDHSDEFNCNPCPLEQGYFHCGNETSCLDPSKRCNGIFDCWDGSDEHLCISTCDDETEFLCSSGKCIEKGQFCDGVRDCPDSSDEPEGCSALTAPGAPVIV